METGHLGIEPKREEAKFQAPAAAPELATGRQGPPSPAWERAFLLALGLKLRVQPAHDVGPDLPSAEVGVHLDIAFIDQPASDFHDRAAFRRQLECPLDHVALFDHGDS